VIEDFEFWARGTEWGAVARSSQWVWGSLESAHFIGLSLMIGMVGLFDLRLLGVAKAIPVAAIHRLIPLGMLGYFINLVSGSLFLFAFPDQYLYNRAFQFKMAFMALAAANILLFYSSAFREAKEIGPGMDAPMRLKLIGGASFALWIAVLTCGRLLTFYRP
jgi:uncharacterized membrane protein